MIEALKTEGRIDNHWTVVQDGEPIFSWCASQHVATAEQAYDQFVTLHDGSEALADARSDALAWLDTERDRRTELDFAYDFGATPARDDADAEIEAGVRQLQMRPKDQNNWDRLHGMAIAALLGGQPQAVLPMRAEDNWNIQTTAGQVLAVLAAATQRGAALVFLFGKLKSAVRAAGDVEAIAALIMAVQTAQDAADLQAVVSALAVD